MNLKPEKYRTDAKCNVSKCNAKKNLTETPTGLWLCPKHRVEWDSEFGGTQAPIVVEDDTTETQLQHEASEAKDALDLITELSVSDQGELEFAAEMLQEVKGHNKRLEEMKQSATRPMNEALKRIREWFKPAQDFYGQAEEIIKEKIVAFKDTQDQKKLEAKQQADDGDTSSALATLQDAEIDEVTGLSYRKIWDFEIEDEDEIPAEFWRIDKSAIKIRLRETDGDPIPGIRPFQRTVAASTSR